MVRNRTSVGFLKCAVAVPQSNYSRGVAQWLARNVRDLEVGGSNPPPPDGARPLKPSRTNEDSSRPLPAFKTPIRTPSGTKRAGKVPQQPSTELGGCLRRKLSPSTVPERPLTDGRAKTTLDGRLNRAALFAALTGRHTGQTARQSTLLTSFAHQGPDLNSAALSTPANTKETNPTTTGDHHVEHNSRRRTVHRRKHRGGN